jgi:hypothetical protein
MMLDDLSTGLRPSFGVPQWMQNGARSQKHQPHPTVISVTYLNRHTSYFNFRITQIEYSFYLRTISKNRISFGLAR